MQIRISKVELLSMLSKQLGYEVTEVVLEKPPKEVLEALLLAMQEVIQGYGYKFDSLDEFKGIFRDPSKKILCIKALREAVRVAKLPRPTITNVGVDTYGLAESKCIIENWTQFYDWVAKHKRLPMLRNLHTSCPLFE